MWEHLSSKFTKLRAPWERVYFIFFIYLYIYVNICSTTMFNDIFINYYAITIYFKMRFAIRIYIMQRFLLCYDIKGNNKGIKSYSSERRKHSGFSEKWLLCYPCGSKFNSYNLLLFYPNIIITRHLLVVTIHNNYIKVQN